LAGLQFNVGLLQVPLLSQCQLMIHPSKETSPDRPPRPHPPSFRRLRSRQLAVCTENLNPNVLTMKSAQYGARIYDAGSLNLARDRRIFVQ
jgi:hypothetical protein